MKKIIVSIILIFLTVVIYKILYRYNIMPHKKYTNEYFNIETYISNVDKDLDGIDDQTDILKNARKYILTKPKYKSKYYSGGYPDDEFGVCVDVVIQSLKGSGYDLMELVDEHIRNNKELYDIDVIDKNIDFRRVRNLYVYFENTAIKLTLDIYDISAWQGGDIVVFKSHIGIVSDKRNKNGVPFIIHHDTLSEHHNYEEDILEYRKDIIGHYRIS